MTKFMAVQAAILNMAIENKSEAVETVLRKGERIRELANDVLNRKCGLTTAAHLLRSYNA